MPIRFLASRRHAAAADAAAAIPYRFIDVFAPLLPLTLICCCCHADASLP